VAALATVRRQMLQAMSENGVPASPFQTKNFVPEAVINIITTDLHTRLSGCGTGTNGGRGSQPLCALALVVFAV
jgi:hypothetical protein